MAVRVFIQNEAGSNRKHYHDEKTLTWLRTIDVSRPYPFPYGFIVGTTGGDGCSVDCYVLTAQALKTGAVLECELLGLMEQWEDGQEDHKVLARLAEEQPIVDAFIQATLADFARGVFAHVPDKQIQVGRMLGPFDAEQYVNNHKDKR